MTDYSTAAVDKSGVLRGLVSTARVPLGSEVYNRLLETLYDEAAALDERRFDDWVAMLHEELVYTAPIRLTRTGPNRDRDVVRTMKHFDDDYASILMRTGRLSKSAWAEDPPRSEEHTSELQSLMRISYAVFCLTTKKHELQ